MKTIKLDDLQKHKMLMALNYCSEVLSLIKRSKLDGRALCEMKILEESVQGLEAFMCGK